MDIERLLEFISPHILICALALHFRTSENRHELQTHSIPKISDRELLQEILPQEIFAQMQRKSHHSLLPFVFALRHSLVFLSALFHTYELSLKNSEIFIEKYKLFLKIFGKKFEENFEKCPIFTEILFPQRQDIIPLLGFSAVGCHLLPCPLYRCRAFDRYEILYCSHSSESGVFCTQHAAEVFWEDTFTEGSPSIQAKMNRFYLHKENFQAVDKEELEKLICSFYNRFQVGATSFHNHKQPRFSSMQLEELLAEYQFTSLQELQSAGKEILRKRFLEKARLSHPDAGGSCDSFRTVRENYEKLKEIAFNGNRFF